MTGDGAPAVWPFDGLQMFKYGVIYADPPWSFENWSAAGEIKNPKEHYDCMTDDAIKALPVNQLATDDCSLFMWATFPMLPQALDVMAAWGFRYVTGGVWHKLTPRGNTAFGTGYVLRSSAELFLIGAVGEPRQRSRRIRNIINAERRAHSQKPDEAYDIIEELWPDTFKCELFARNLRPGWDSWGNEAPNETGDPLSGAASLGETNHGELVANDGVVARDLLREQP